MKNTAKQNTHATDYATRQASGESSEARITNPVRLFPLGILYPSDFFLGYFSDKYRFMLALG